MLSFNPILSQSTAMQGGPPPSLTLPLRESTPSSVGARCACKFQAKFSLFATMNKLQNLKSHHRHYCTLVVKLLIVLYISATEHKYFQLDLGYIVKTGN